MPIHIKQQNPKNAGVGWSQACGFWRSSASICPNVLTVKNQIGACGTTSMIAVGGGWITGVVGHNCSDTDSYIDTARDYYSGAGCELAIDVWKALADGLWSSSVVLTVYSALTGAVPFGLFEYITALPSPATSSPASQNKALPSPPVQAIGCPTTSVATITIYDDGTFTLT